jgi:ubiquinone/menaquinone biosynthesis C-methylase UbiE
MDETRIPDWDRRRRAEAERVLSVYEARDARSVGSRYSLTSVASLMAVQERERYLLGQLARRGWEAADLDCLDVGCGTGGELARLVAYGADPRRLHGVDLREDAIAAAKSRLPLCDIVVGDASELHYATGSMDIVLQFTTLSSILDDEVRQRVAAEMIRVCRPAGLILSYDFMTNPTNADTRGLSGGEVRGLFPGCQISIHRVTLAPPVARRIAPRSRRLAALLGAIPPLRTHLIAFATPGPNLSRAG